MTIRTLTSPMTCVFVLALTGCNGAAPSTIGSTQAALDSDDGGVTDDGGQPSNLLAGPWQLAASDLTPSTSYSVAGDELNLTWGGYYSWNGTWQTGFTGYTFSQPAALEAGATYALTLTVSNVSNPIPVVLYATVGDSAQQSQTLFSPGTTTLTFIVTDPGATPSVQLVAHPALGHLGPLYSTGVLFQSYSVSASLTRTN
jgi:hypothetical protein